MVNPQDWIEIAIELALGAARGGVGRPRQAELRRAVSSAYYALFHTLSRSNADTLVGATRAARNRAAWRQTYRALDHGYARNQCSNRAAMGEFPDGIQVFGQRFVDLQGNRHDADYDPDSRFSRRVVMKLIDESRAAISAFNAVDAAERRAFAVHVLLRNRSR